MPVPNLDLDMNMIIGGDATSAIPGDELVGNSVHSMSRCPTSRQRDRTRSEDMDPLFLDEDEQLRLAIQNSLQPSNPHTSGVPVPPTTHTRSRSLDDDDSFQLNTELPIPSRTQSSGPMQHPYLRRIDNEPPPPPRCQAYNLTKTAPVAPGEQRNFDPFGANQSSTERPGAYSVASRAVGTIPFRNRISSHVRAPFRSNSNRRVLRTESGRIRRTSRVQRDSSAPVQTSANASSRPVVSHTPHSRIPQSNISPGLRDPSSRSFVSYTSHSEVSQSHIPPELRTRRRRRRSRRSSRRSSLFQFFLGEVPDAECGVAAVSSFSREQKEYEGDVQKGIAILLLSGIIVVAVTVGVAIAATNKGKSSVPIMSPAAEITQTPAPTCRLEIIQSNLEHLSRNSAVLNDPTSPQYYALTWIANDDEAKIDEGDQARLESRFALATFFFATNGANWDDDLGFLNSVHECNWKSNVTGEGVGCNEDDEIKRIIIGKSSVLKCLNFVRGKADRFSETQITTIYKDTYRRKFKPCRCSRRFESQIKPNKFPEFYLY